MMLKIGQRVRVKVAGTNVQHVYGFTPPAGKEGVIVSLEQPGWYGVAVFGVLPPPGKPGWKVASEYLEPLTGPSDEAWAADKVRKLPRPAIRRERSPAHV
jgi:hypothetical protein